MTEQFARVSVSLTRDEFIALARLAQNESRLPKQQARHILRNALLSTNDNTASAEGFAGQSANGVVSTNNFQAVA